MSQPITFAAFLTFITVALQNLYPFQRSDVLQQLKFASPAIVRTNPLAPYSGMYVHIDTNLLEAEV